MHISILGGGSVGYAIAESLCNGYHNITVVENDPQRAERLKELDVQVVFGSAADPGILFKAGVSESDLCLAVTGIEEVNTQTNKSTELFGANANASKNRNVMVILLTPEVLVSPLSPETRMKDM